MKKLFLLSFLLAFVFNTDAQETKTEKKVKATEKSVKAKKEAVSKTPLKKDATPDKRYNAAKKANVPLKKDGTPDKRYNALTKKNNASATGQTRLAEAKARANANKEAAKIKREKPSNEKAPKKKDKATGMYKGKVVYTGPRGGEYYINSNGNKTYISD